MNKQLLLVLCVLSLATAGCPSGDSGGGGVDFVPVTGITLTCETTVEVNTPLDLTAEVSPDNAANSAITWSVKTDGGTGAVINGNTLTAAAAGEATITACVANGTADGDYAQDFTITVKAAKNMLPFDADGNAVITEGGVFYLSGSPGGTVTVDTDGEVTLILEDLVLGSIDVLRAASVSVTLAEGKSASLAGNIWSAAPLSIDGEGSLAVDVGYDGTQADGYKWTAIHSDALLTVSSGTLVLRNCYEGLEGENVIITGGDIDIKSYNDCINADPDSSQSQHVAGGSDITISGGNIQVEVIDLPDNSNHWDSQMLDADGVLAISGGVIKAAGYSDTFHNGTGCVITGGRIFSCAESLASSPSSASTQKTVMLRLPRAYEKGSAVEIKSEDDTVIVDETAPRLFSVLVISIPEFTDTSSYSLFIDGVQVGAAWSTPGIVNTVRLE